MPWQWLYNTTDIGAYEQQCLNSGYEGIILRNPEAAHKSGRASTKNGSYLRIKRFSDAEAIVIGFEEAVENTNEQKLNELGRHERSTHQANMAPKGMIGNIRAALVKDLVVDGKLMHKAGDSVVIGPGELSHEERVYYFNNFHEMMGKVVKFKFFGKGCKDTVRFPTFMSFREKEDM